MRTTPLLFLLTGTLLLGCRPKAPSTISASTNGVTAPFEGKYSIVGNPECTVIMTNGVYLGATPYNLTGSLNGSGKYTTKTIDDNTWELAMVAQPWTLIVRRRGGSVWLGSKESTNQVELRRK